jgi:cytoskeletal protein RodZ
VKLMRKRRSQAALRLDQVQSLSLAELGEHLHQRRDQKGLSLEQVAATTKIQRRLLQAIEAGQMDVLPESVYIRGLLKRFAEALDLPGEEFAQQFPVDTVSTRPRFWIYWSWGQLQPIHLYFLYVFLIFSSVNGLSMLMSRSAPSSASSLPLELELPDRPATQAKKTADQQKLNLKEFASSALKSAFPLTDVLTLEPIAHLKTQQTALQKLPAPSPVAPDKPVQVLVSVKEQSWMRVTVDEENSFEGILSAGVQRTWAGEKNVTIRAGNAGGVLVALNDQTPKPLGDAGAVEEVSFSSTP